MKINYYLVAYIDILGQGAKLSKINKLPKTKEEKEEFNKLLNDTADNVKKLHEVFQSYFDGFKEIRPEIKEKLESWTQEMRDKFKKSKEIKLKYLYFSDTVVLYFPLDKETNVAPLGSVYAALTSAASTFLIMLSEKTPLRGAINIGIGTELKNSGIYGPILQNLHCLESKVAEYPRVIIGDELIQMIEDYDKETIDETDIYKTINKSLIPNINELIKIDSDKIRILNYLNKSMADAFEAKRTEFYKKIKSFTDEQLKEYKGNEKLYNRYKKLRSYIRKNRSNWV